MRFSETKTLWNEWEIRVLVLASLFLQLFLISLGGVRKRNVSATIGLLLWLFYLMADSIAIYALGYLSHNQDMSGVPDNNPTSAPSGRRSFSSTLAAKTRSRHSPSRTTSCGRGSCSTWVLKSSSQSTSSPNHCCLGPRSSSPGY
uniref:DUF4220 domain-containing protein n=1 Tax=Ananas comosus var. bracteatus TaxID=296719 RepID=A0A6V7NWU5_ANACO|nr:unnamed protein product [Ananas comosus var. bracteatus]